MPRTYGQTHTKRERFLLYLKVQTATEAHPTTCLMGCWGGGWVFPRGYNGWGNNLTTSIYLMQRLRMSGTVPPLPHMPSWHAQRQLYIYFFCYFILIFEAAQK
jgi:hypothetical protein